MDLQTARRVRRSALVVVATASLLSIHAIGFGWVASASVTAVAVIIGLVASAELLYRARQRSVGNYPADDGVLDREWDVTLAMMYAVNLPIWAGRLTLREQTERRDVDWSEIMGYALVLLQEQLRRADGGLPSKQELRATASRAYPRWKRMFPGEPESTLSDLLLDAYGYDDAPLPGLFYLITYYAVAASVLISGSKATLMSKRAELAAQLKVNHAWLERMQREGKINPEDTR
jgi:hypothetical protein